MTNGFVAASFFAIIGGMVKQGGVGGLFAVDIAPKGATGAAMGFVGIFSYLGAAIQENVSASLISNNTIITDGNRIYDFDSAIMFWIGSSIVSLLLAASLWNTKAVKYGIRTYS